LILCQKGKKDLVMIFPKNCYSGTSKERTRLGPAVLPFVKRLSMFRQKGLQSNLQRKDMLRTSCFFLCREDILYPEVTAIGELRGITLHFSVDVTSFHLLAYLLSLKLYTL